MKTRICSVLLAALLLSALVVANAFAQPELDSPYAKTAGEHLEPVKVNPELGKQLDLSRPFINSAGEQVTLKSAFLTDRPLVVVPAYFGCPMLCGLLSNGVAELLETLDLRLGTDYSVVTVSFDPTEGPELSAKAKDTYNQRLAGKANVDGGWSFYTTVEGSSAELMKELGFGYRLVDGEYAHSAVVYLITPDGKISQYFTGVEFSNRVWDIKMALIEASKKEIGSLIEQALLYCFQFDPSKGKYSFVAFNIVRGGALLGLFALAFLLVRLWRAELRKKKFRDTGVAGA